jgi:hypothetical protein
MPDAGVDLRDVQIAARHAHPRTTMRAWPAYLYRSRCAENARTCRVEVRLTVDGAVSAVAGTPEVGLGDRGREMHGAGSSPLC